VARVTVRQAIELLAEEGLLYCQQGRGTFVTDEPPKRRWLNLATDWTSLIEPIKDHVPKMLKVQNPPAAPVLRPGEGKAAASYVYLRSVQYRGAEPFSLVNLHLARDVFDRAPAEFRKHPALHVLASVDRPQIKRAHQTLVIGGADPETADLLNMGVGAPTAECRCIVLDEHDRAIYVGNITYPSDCIKLHMELFRGPSLTGSAREASARRRRPRAACV
ncbi:MAG: GntR family transcriptional regulator, partial [Microvirga sp.]